MSYIVQLGANYVCNDDSNPSPLIPGSMSAYSKDARHFVKFAIARDHAVQLAENNLGIPVKVRNKQTLDLAMEVVINVTTAR